MVALISKKRKWWSTLRSGCKWANLNFDFVASHPCDSYIYCIQTWFVVVAEEVLNPSSDLALRRQYRAWISARSTYEGKHVTRRSQNYPLWIRLVSSIDVLRAWKDFLNKLVLWDSLHEHQNGQRKWGWDVQAIYDHFAKPPRKWPPAKSRPEYILGVCTGKQSAVRRNEVDLSSIMMYPIPRALYYSPWHLWRNYRDIPSNSELFKFAQRLECLRPSYSEDAIMKRDEMEFCGGRLNF